MASDSELDEFYDAVDETPNGSFLKQLNEASSENVDISEEEKELLELRRKQEERRKKEDEEMQQKLQFLLQKKKAEQLKREEEERKEQLEKRRRKHEALRRRMISKDDSVQITSSEESDLEELVDELDDAETLNRSLEQEVEIKDKYSEYFVNISASHPDKDKQNKEIYGFIDGGSKMDTIDHNFVPDTDVVDGVFLENYTVDDENEPDIVKSTKTRTPPNTLQSYAQPVQTVQETNIVIPKLRIQTDIIVGKAVSDNSKTDRQSVQPVPEAVVTPPSPTFQQPVAPPRRKKKAKMSSSSVTSQTMELSPPSERSSIGSSISDFDLKSPESPGLPSEAQDIPADFERLTKQLEYSLDLRSLIHGKRHINAEEADAHAVNSDHDSPIHTLESGQTNLASGKTDSVSRPSSGKNSKTSSLDREGKNKNTSLDRNSSFDKRSSLDRTDGRLQRKKSKSSSLENDTVKMRSRNSSGHEASPKRDLRPRSASGKVLTDEEILEGFIVKNLDTGETTNLKEAEKKLPKCVDPLVLHIMQRTKDYGSSDEGKKDKDDEYETRSEGGTILSGVKIKKTGYWLKKLLKKKVDKAADKVKTAADQVMHGDDQDSVDEEISDEGRRYKFKAKHNRKGPWEFGQLKVIQDLGDHTGAIWVMKFSPCGRLLATGGQDNVLRIWVLKSAFNYFDDMRQKYAESSSLRVTPAPSQESLDSIPSVSEVSSMELGATAESEESKKGPFKGKPFCKYKGHTADLLDISWSKNYFILSSSMDKTVRLWHISRRECLCTFQHIDFVTAIVFHPKDDRYFLSGSLDGKLRLWNIPDKKVTLWNEVGSKSLITTANFCHNGKFAVVGTYDGKCIFYSTEHLKYYTQIHVRSTRGKNSRGHKITCIEPLLGEDKVLVTSNDSRVRLYDLRDLTLVCKYKGHTNTSSQIRATFSPKGKYVISGSEDHFIYLWKTQHEYKFSSARRDRNDYYEAVKGIYRGSLL